MRHSAGASTLPSALPGFDKQAILAELEGIELRPSPSAFPLTSSTADTFPAELLMEPLAFDFSDRKLLQRLAGQRSAEEQSAMNLNYRQEKEFYDNALPNAQDKLARLRRDIDELRARREAAGQGELARLQQERDRAEAQLRRATEELEALRRQVGQAQPHQPARRATTGEFTGGKAESGYSASYRDFNDAESVRTNLYSRLSGYDAPPQTTDRFLAQNTPARYAPAQANDYSAQYRSQRSVSQAPHTATSNKNPLFKLPKF